MSLTRQLSRYVWHPLLDIKERSSRLGVLRELDRSQWLSLEELRSRQWHLLRAMVAYADAHCAYYRQLFRENAFDPANFTARGFQRLPVLTKTQIRANTDGLLSKEFNRIELGCHKTGGSTGVALTTYFDRQWLEVRTADAMRSNQWAGCYHDMKTAALWGNSPHPTSWKGRLRALLLERFIWLDTMNLSDQTMSQFVERWRAERPEILFEHSHSLYVFARFVKAKGITDLRPRGIISTSMMLLRQKRELIEAAFGCKVTDRYGCKEVGLIACECEQHAGLHLNIEHLYIEFRKPDGTEAGPGEEGVIVLTDLLNRGMPLIRYRVEDVGVPTDKPCVCGRGLPLTDRITSRVADFLKRPDSSLVAGVSLVERTHTAIAGIEQMQIIREACGHIVLKLVLIARFDSDARRALLDEFAGVFGQNVRMNIESAQAIAQEASGKYRFSICRV